MTGTPVTVVVDGTLVAGSTSAQLRDGVVLAPLDPYVRTFATRITREADGRIVIERSGAVVTLSLGSHAVRTGTAIGTVTIAPYLRADRTIVPLAAVARALGATVTYDPRSHTISLVLARGELRTPVPFVTGASPAQLQPTFSPTATPQATPTVGAMPRPRRTPIEVDPPRGTLRRSWEEGAHG